MGMGEPLYNFEAVRDAIAIVADGEGLASRSAGSRSRRRASCPRSCAPAHEIGSMLAISLHATSDEIRDRLVPLNRKYPIAELLAACRAYPGLSNAAPHHLRICHAEGRQRRAGRDARGLVKLLAGIPAKVNLIPFNPWPGSAYECSDRRTIERFAAVRQPCRLCQPGAHAARPRHPRCLRPAQIGVRAAAGPRAPGCPCGS